MKTTDKKGKGESTENLDEKRKLALEIIEKLKQAYPDAGCTLDYDDAWKLLVSVRLAAQCTDAQRECRCGGVYIKNFQNVNALAEAHAGGDRGNCPSVRPWKEQGAVISVPVCGCCVMNTTVRCLMILMHCLKLPGVGRKSANLIMGDVFGKPAIVTDTHCIRLTNRMGLVDGIKEPKKVEMALWKIIPPEEGSDFCHRLVEHGRAVCTARTKPYCERCVLQEICPKIGV